MIYSFYAENRWDNARACWVVGETQDYWIDIVPMIFNHRIVMTPKSNPEEYVVGWCYPSMDQAYVAIQRWNPDDSWKPDPNISNFRPTEFLKEVGL